MKKILLTCLISTAILAETKVRNAITQGAPVNVIDKGADNTGVANSATAIQLAIDSCTAAPRACRVIIPRGQYNLTVSLKLKIGTVIDCEAGDVAGSAEIGGTAGTILKTTGAIWAFENATPTVSLVNNVVIHNCTIDLSGNASALGAFNFRSVSWSKLYNVNVVLPSTGAMEGVRFDAQDVFGSFWNELHGVNINALGSANTHKAVRWINAANSNTVFGGNMTKAGTAYSLESGNSNAVFGGGTDTFAVGCINLGNSATVIGNTFLGLRCESTGSLFAGGAVAITVGAAAYNNRVQSVFVTGSSTLAQVLVDNSSGQNTIAVTDTGGNANILTLGSKNGLLKAGINQSNSIGAGLDMLGVLRVNSAPIIANNRVSPTYSASVTIDNSLSNWFSLTATNGTAFTVTNPTQPYGGQDITITISNTSGGALGAITWGTNYKLAGAWVSPATANQRSIIFRYNGVSGLWYEIARTAADVPN